MHPSSAFLILSSLLATILPTVNADGLYTRKSPVLLLNHKNYDQQVTRSNHTSVIEFYAPWCSHCQNLKPAYEKVAKNLEGLAKVGAVNCDDDDNKPLCGRLGIQGFPTLKIVTPSTKKPGKPSVEDYRGPRSAKAIADAVAERIPNHVKKLADKDVEGWVSQDENVPKMLLITNKGTTSALIRALAVDFLGKIRFAQLRNKDSITVERFGVEKLPALVLYPGDGKEPVVYDGELRKNSIVEFLSQVAVPNPDYATTTTTTTTTAKQKSVDDEAEKHKPTKSSSPKATPEEDTKETKPTQAPIQTPEIKSLPTVESLESTCLSPKSGTCVLTLLPEVEEADSGSEPQGPAKEALQSLSEVIHKHFRRQSKLFPFYSVAATNPGSNSLRESLGLSTDNKAVEIIATNGRRGWWRRYASETGNFESVPVEAWIDSIKLGEGPKEKLPDGVLVAEKQKQEPVEEAAGEQTKEEETKDEHDEL